MHPLAMQGWRIKAGDGLQWRDALLALALFAAVVRALIPQGFMLAEHDGRVDVVICTTDGAVTISGVPRDGDTRGDALAGMSAPCAFAALAAAAPPPSLDVVAVAQAIELRILRTDERLPLRAGVPFRPQSPRAPPTLHA